MMDLFIQMTKPNPANRPSVKDVLAHPWVNGQVCS